MNTNKKEILTEREEQVLKLRKECKTYAEIGETFGVTRERVRQIEAKALRKLRMQMQEKGY